MYNTWIISTLNLALPLLAFWFSSTTIDAMYHVFQQDVCPSSHCKFSWQRCGHGTQTVPCPGVCKRLLCSIDSNGSRGKTYYHWTVDPIRKAQLPQNVASEASYSAPVLPYAGPRHPQSYIAWSAAIDEGLMYIYRKAECSNEIPKPNVPAQDFPSRNIPFRLRLEHVQCTRYDEPWWNFFSLSEFARSGGYIHTRSTYDLRHPVYSIKQTLIHFIIDIW